MSNSKSVQQKIQKLYRKIEFRAQRHDTIQGKLVFWNWLYRETDDELKEKQTECVSNVLGHCMHPEQLILQAWKCHLLYVLWRAVG